MIKLSICDDYSNKTFYKISRYANDNVATIIRVLKDLLDDNNDFTAADFLPWNNLRIGNDKWLEMVDELYEIVTSDVFRDYLKPKYEYLLYIILKWWEDCADSENDLLPLRLDEELKKEILNYDWQELNGQYYVDIIANYREYYDFLFQDYDFLPDNLSRMLVIYLRSPEIFSMFFPDVELNDYYELMPKDLQEQYDVLKKNILETKNVDIEQMLYDDIIFCCERIQADCDIKNLLENKINDRLRDLLDAKKYYVRDQTRQGKSSAGKEAGEIDILVKIGKKTISVIEALKLSSVNENYISEHIDKIYNYDTIGNAVNYIISYVSSKNFNSFYEKYKNYILNYKYPYELIGYDFENFHQFAELRTIEVTLNREGKSTKLYHLLIHLQD